MDIRPELREIISMDNDPIAIKKKLFALYDSYVPSIYDITDELRIVGPGLPKIKNKSLIGVKAILSIRIYPEMTIPKIPAIKWLRNLENIGLKEAKNIVDYLVLESDNNV